MVRGFETLKNYDHSKLFLLFLQQYFLPWIEALSLRVLLAFLVVSSELSEPAGRGRDEDDEEEAANWFEPV